MTYDAPVNVSSCLSCSLSPSREPIYAATHVNVSSSLAHSYEANQEVAIIISSSAMMEGVKKMKRTSRLERRNKLYFSSVYFVTFVLLGKYNTLEPLQRGHHIQVMEL